MEYHVGWYTSRKEAGLTTNQRTDVTCRHCQRRIVNVDGRWIDPEATGDDSVWRETCDGHDTFSAEHEPLYRTPGPWYYVGGSIWTTPGGHDDGGVNIGGANRNEPRTHGVERDENTQLMAAAPDLLAAAQLTLSWLGEEVDSELVGENAARDSLRNAIAKARGEDA